jgi:hypothetical protein
MARQTEEPFLVVHVRPAINDIEKFLRVRTVAAFMHDRHDAALLDDEESASVIRDIFHPKRAIKTQLGEDRMQFNVRQDGRRVECKKNAGRSQHGS